MNKSSSSPARGPMSPKKGFTLIELMIVIIILGILSTIGFSLFQSTQKKSRDLGRKAALSAVVKALASYMADKGVYPPSQNGKIQWCGSDGSTACEWGTALTDTASSGEDATVYLSTLPKDTVANQTFYYEAVSVDGKNKGYRLYAKLENTKDPDAESPYIGAACTVGSTTQDCNYTLTSDTVAAPESCLASKSSCSGSGDSRCCVPGSCTQFFGTSGTCSESYYCESAPSGFSETQLAADGTTCSTGSKCCTGKCTTFYKDISCDANPVCGTSVPSGSKTKNTGSACTTGTECCGGYCCGGKCSTRACCTQDTLACTTGTECCSRNCCGGKCMVAGTVLTTYYRDQDGDKYPKSTDKKQSCTGAPTGYIAQRSDNKWDCYDQNANAKPGSTYCGTANRGDGSYDYNCVNGTTLCGTSLYTLSTPTCCDSAFQNSRRLPPPTYITTNCHGYTYRTLITTCGKSGYPALSTNVTKLACGCKLYENKDGGKMWSCNCNPFACTAYPATGAKLQGCN